MKREHYFLLLCFVLLAASIATTKISDYDFWWHLKLGETVFNSGHIYNVDDFSYTFGGQPQFNGEWLADLLIYSSYEAGGDIGVAILKLALVLFTFFFLLQTVWDAVGREDTGLYASVLTLVVVLFSLRFRLFVRPYLFTFLFFSVFLFLISRYESRRDVKTLFLLPLLEIVWANVSKGAFYGPMLLLLLIAADGMGKRIDRRLVVSFVAVAACALLNPATYRIYTLALGVSVGKGISEVVGEHQPLSWGLLWGYGLKYTFAYQVLVAGSLIWLVLFRGWKNSFRLLLFAAFLLQSVRMVRMIDFFSLASAALFAPSLERALKKLPAAFFERRTYAAGCLAAAQLALIPLSVFGGTYSFGVGVKEGMFPDEAVSFLERERVEGRMFNSYPFGGYLAWRAPNRKVFIDGRGIGALYSNEFYNGYFEMIKDEDAWRAAEQRWGFDYAVLEYDQISRRFPAHLKDNPGWALVYWDNAACVYLKRSDRNLPIIGRYEYKIAKPTFYDFSYLQAHLHSKTALTAAGELDREIALNTANQEPRLAKAYLLYGLGRSYHDAALRELEVVLTLKPDLAIEHSAAAFLLYEKGDKEAAKKELRKALSLDPADPGAAELKKILRSG